MDQNPTEENTQIDRNDSLYKSLTPVNFVDNLCIWITILLIIPILSTLLFLILWLIWISVFSTNIEVLDHYLMLWLYGFFILIFILIAMLILAPILACHINPLVLYPFLKWLRDLIISPIRKCFSTIENYSRQNGAVIANSNV